MRTVAAMGLVAFVAGITSLSILPAKAQSSGGAPQPSRVIQEAPLSDCDTYAASDFDARRNTKGIPYGQINPALAIPACESAVRQYPNSQRLIFQLGRAYSKSGNFVAALQQFRKAAEQGYPMAEYNLGLMYENGEGVAKDYAEAAVWFRKAAEQGNALAQNSLGTMYAYGQGISENFAEAMKWYRMAADQGNARAQNNLAAMYTNGQGAPKNDTEAVKWYRKAADQGDTSAQTSLGRMYENGQGVSKNSAEAMKWWRKAADQGNAEAFAALTARSRAAEPTSIMGRQITPVNPSLTQTEIEALHAQGSAMLKAQVGQEQRPATERKESTGGAYKSNWRKIEADNGAAFGIDMNSIRHNYNGTADVSVCAVDNHRCDLPSETRLLFDCHGHYQDLLHGSIVQLAPSRSVVGQMEALACAGAKDIRFLDTSDKPNLSGTTPAEYCQGFSSASCTRIKEIVEAKTRPAFCKSGYGVVGSGLTLEQVRACDVIGSKDYAVPPTLVEASTTSALSVKPGETIIGQWSGKGNGKSRPFRVERGPWEFRVTSTDYISADVYNAATRTAVASFGGPDGQRVQVRSSGDLYFVIKTTGRWTVVAVSP